MRFDPTRAPAGYPQLRSLCWNRRGDESLEGAEALGLYERNWPMMDRDNLSAAERALIDRLIEDYGNGVFLTD